MGTITPNGTVFLLKGVPLDNSYNETLYTAYDGTKTLAQNQQALAITFLNTFTHVDFTAHSYQRVSDGVLRLNTTMLDVFNCNYMIFKNSGALLDGQGQLINASYPDKWFFAFVNNVEYINEQAVNIYYEIDVIQTWIFDMILYPCMIERQHVSDDSIGANTQAEPVTTGELVCMYTSSTEYFDEIAILLGLAAGMSFTPSDYDSNGGGT